MLQVQVLRQQTEWVKERLAVRHYPNIGLVDEILQTDDELRKVKFATENIQASINGMSKEIGMLMGKGLKEEAEHEKQEVAALKTALALASGRSS